MAQPRYLFPELKPFTLEKQCYFELITALAKMQGKGSRHRLKFETLC